MDSHEAYCLDCGLKFENKIVLSLHECTQIKQEPLDIDENSYDSRGITDSEQIIFVSKESL